MARLKCRRIYDFMSLLPPSVSRSRMPAHDQSVRDDAAKASAMMGSNRTSQHLNQNSLVPAGLLQRHVGALGNQVVRRLLLRQHPGSGLIGPSFRVQRLPGQVLGEAGPQAGVLAQPVADKSNGMPPPETRRMVRQGSSGPEVAYAQERLNAHGAMPPLAVDAIFGPLTRKAAIEYQKSHGLVPDAIIGPRTWASLDGPAQLGGSSGGGLGGGAGGPGSKMMQYETGNQIFSPPASGTKLSTIRDQIKAKQDKKPLPDLGKTVTAKGVTQGSDEEIYVWNILLQRAERRFWGSEIDAVTRIGPSTKAGGPAPAGQVTVKIDGAGNAIVELIKPGAVNVPVSFKDEPSAKGALIKDFGFSAVKDGSAIWQLADLNKVHAALSRLTAAERAALKRVDLVRDSTLADKNGKPLAGEFRHESKLATDGKSASRAQSLHIADLAFASDTISFTGGAGVTAVASFHTIIHEAAHAVESKVLCEAEFARLEATTALNVEIEKVNNVVNVVNPESRAAFGKAKKYSKAEKKSGNAYLAAINATTAAINTFAGSQNLGKLDTQEAAAARRDAAKKTLPAGHPAQTDFARLRTLQDDWFSAAKERAVAFKAFKAAEGGEQAATGSKKGMSKRLQNFVNVVNKHNIPPLTEYAKKNWPNQPQEFYAEAFALWKNDPAYLKLNAEPLKDWFDAGEHLK